MVVDDWKKDESDERRQYGASKRILFIYLNVKKKNFVGCAGREEYDTSLPRRKRLTVDDDEVIRVMGVFGLGLYRATQAKTGSSSSLSMGRLDGRGERAKALRLEECWPRVSHLFLVSYVMKSGTVPALPWHSIHSSQRQVVNQGNHLM